MPVFISHSTRDREDGERIHRALKNAGFESFISSKDLTKASVYRRELEEKLARCSHFVLLYSRRVAANPDNVLDEIDEILRRPSRPRIIVIRIDETPLALGFNLGLNRWQHIHCFNGLTSAGIDDVLKAASKRPDGTSTEKASGSEGTAILIMFLLVGGAIATGIAYEKGKTSATTQTSTTQSVDSESDATTRESGREPDGR